MSLVERQNCLRLVIPGEFTFLYTVKLQLLAQNIVIYRPYVNEHQTIANGGRRPRNPSIVSSVSRGFWHPRSPFPRLFLPGLPVLLFARARTISTGFLLIFAN